MYVCNECNVVTGEVCPNCGGKDYLPIPLKSKINLEIGNVEMKVFHYEDVQVLWIGGTDEFEDIIPTLKFLPNNEGWHSGICEKVQEIFPSVLPHLIPNLPIIVSGYSYGGAIAERMAYVLYRDERETIQYVKTYGAFLCGSKSYFPPYPIYRVRRGKDIVPFLFPWYKGEITHTLESKGEFPRFAKDHKYYPMDEKRG